MNPSELWRQNGLNNGDRTAVIFEDRRQSYGELFARASRLANALGDAGVRPGDRVAILADNVFESLEQWAACALGNFVRSSLYAFLTPDVNAHLLNDIGATALIVHNKYYDQIAPHLADISSLKVVILSGGATRDGVPSYEKFLATGAPEAPNPVISPDDPHIIRFTGGTTGMPKAILHSVQGWTEVGIEFGMVLPHFDQDDSFIVAGPLTHAAGIFIWPFINVGAPSVVMPAFDPAKFIALVQEHKVRTTQVVPTMVQAILLHPDAADADFSSFRAIVYGGAPMPEAILRSAIARWGNIMYQLYGQSEAIGGVTVLPPEDHHLDGTELERSWLRSAGRPTPRGQVKIVDEKGDELPGGDIGEVAVSSPALLKEIWGDPEATAARTLPDGWWLTRDMGYVSKEGFLFLVDRKDDMIISGGYNIWPFELENVLAEHPEIAEAAVVGIPHPKWIETPCAAVVLRSGAEVSEQEVIDFVKDRLGSVKKPTRVVFMDDLPKSGVGKILRRQVRERVEALDMVTT